MSCFVSISVIGCSTEKRIERTPIPLERIDCVQLQGDDSRPALEELYVIPWQVLLTAAAEGGWTASEALVIAQAEFDKYTKDRNEDDKEIGEYIFRLEDRVFRCANDAKWLREREERLEKEGH